MGAVAAYNSFVFQSSYSTMTPSACFRVGCFFCHVCSHYIISQIILASLLVFRAVARENLTEALTI